MNQMNEPVHLPTGSQTVGGLNPINDSRTQDGQGRRRDRRKRRKPAPLQTPAAPPAPPRAAAGEGHVDVLA